ncbi:MAG: hypothetical protein GY797_30695 [Deltaproteobacteria bacterium]|nr:hypothetical protein [Deltaproteobacteria bacterium]
MSETKTWRFNFGPIGRTQASGTDDTFNLASLSLHETINALMAATNRDELISWLWHDLFKPAFYFIPKKKKPKEAEWHHNPGLGDFKRGLQPFADATKIPKKYVERHHWGRSNQFTVPETAVMSDQSDQVNLGKGARFVQLSFGVEPALTTALVRAVIADAFIKVVTESVAAALKAELASKTPVFNKVRFVFETVSGVTFLQTPTETEIWNTVGQHFDVYPSGDELILKHLTPVTKPEHLSYKTEVAIDLTGKMPSPAELIHNTLALAELLVVYQDSRTLLLSIPQPQIYQLDESSLADLTYLAARQKLEELNAIVTDSKDGTNYLEAAFTEQIEIREVPRYLWKPPGQKWETRPIDRILVRPIELLKNTKAANRICRLCGSAFDSKLKPVDPVKRFSADFTDTEHVGHTKDVCPLCRLYCLNTPGAKKGEGKRKVLRGAFALVIPSSHFGYQKMEASPVERPPLDKWGRFKSGLNRVTVTTQEFTLFQQMSRRIVAQLWHDIAPAEQLLLPYLGAILLTHREEQTQRYIRKLLPKFRNLFKKVQLRAYPFEVDVAPAVEIALDVAVGDAKHPSRHTYLKTRSATLPICPESRLFVLMNNHFQIELSTNVFKAVDQLQIWTEKMGSKQRDYWLKQILSGSDPISAFYEMTKATKKSQTVESTAFNYAGKYWETLSTDPDNFGSLWEIYEKMNSDVKEVLNRYPFLVNLFSTLKERSNE